MGVRKCVNTFAPAVCVCVCCSLCVHIALVSYMNSC